MSRVRQRQESNTWTAFAAAEEHRAEMHRLLGQLKLAESLEEVTRVQAEMTRVADEYEASFRTATIALRAENDQLAARLKDVEDRQSPT